MTFRPFWIISLCCILPAVAVSAQDPASAKPVVGLRENRTSTFAFVGGDVVTEPGVKISNATIVIRGTSILAIGADVQVPAGAKVIDCKGKTIYPGLIDAWGEADVPLTQSDAVYWNSNVTPQRSASPVAVGAVTNASKLRSQGITMRLVAPRGGIVKGSSSLVLLCEGDSGRQLLKERVWNHLQLSVPRTGSRPRYPNSPMGAVALLRQSMYDANWYRDAWGAYRADTELPRPETNLALETLAGAMADETFVIDAPNERMAIRADKIAREFSLRAILRGSGREYRSLDDIAAANRTILVPVDFPESPSVGSAWTAKETSLQELMHWDLAPENPARLAAADVTICLTTDGLDDPGQFLKQVRTAVARGLDSKTALAAVTVEPAKLLGVDDVAGRLKPGMLANFFIADGDPLVDSGAKVQQTWIAGQSFEIQDPAADSDPLAGDWNVRFRSKNASIDATLRVKQDGNKVSGEFVRKVKKEEQTAKLEKVLRQSDRLTATVQLAKLDPTYPDGVARLNLLTVSDSEQGFEVFGTIVLPDGKEVTLQLKRIEAAAKADKPKETSKEEQADSGDSKTDDEEETVERVVEATPVLFPLGASGLSERKKVHDHVMFRGATVWTCEETGTIENADVIIRDGKIVAVGTGLQIPDGCRVIDVKGKHISPGLIDCHSHMGTDGGVNESGQVVTAEVRIGDFIDNTDINIYRQLAGGLTTSNILHGSANPIGGQNQVVKLRWGETMDGLRMKSAPSGIKFALGENVKRSQSRYPNTRMGVEQIIRDQLLAAREYDAKWRRWRAGQHDSLPPRVDLQLEALAEVQRGERWIHCHSYRQDEIVATLDVLEEFGIRIGTLQHILEGYKVADRMAKHGAMGSAFSDWWAYKFEVYDAIPYNGALMHERGVVVSFNSDDRELARHLNHEAAKATKYGNVSEEEALKFVTLNPAKQLRIDQHVGSIQPGKDADLVVWSRRPLSTMARCEQTWIDGRLYFDLKEDQQMRERDSQLRARLIQKVLDGGSSAAKPKEKEIAEEDRWVRRDIYCVAFGAKKHEIKEHEQK